MVVRYLPSNSNDELCHHGVKGQKWGVRHERERIGRKKIGAEQDDETVKKKKKMDKVQKVLLGTAAVAGTIVLARWTVSHKDKIVNAATKIDKAVNHATKMATDSTYAINYKEKIADNKLKSKAAAMAAEQFRAGNKNFDAKAAYNAMKDTRNYSNAYKKGRYYAANLRKALPPG